jgi:hypothetical protein
MQPETYYTSTGAVWADALFVSAMQRSDRPSKGQVLKAIAAAVCAYGDRGCAEQVAQEFGDHPETAVARMRWARAMAREAVGWVPEPAPDSMPDSMKHRPGLLVTRPRTGELATR